MVRRTLMLRDQELADFDVNPSTGEARIVDMASDDLATSLGLTGKNRDQVLATLIMRRTLSPLRKDMNDVLATFRATSPVDLALMGHGLSLSDQFWYRAPGASEHWKDVNFFDNDWDPDFGASVLLGDYTRLAACSPDVPEATTPGHAVKAWERNDGGIFLVKAAEYPDGSELVGAKLGSELCSLLLGEGHYVPLDVVERYGRPCSISPLMLHGDEELANGNRLCAMANMWENPSLMSKGGITAEACDALIDAYAAIGIADASAHVARRACFSCLSLFLDFSPGNYGAIRRVDSEVWRVAPIFDYDGAFGFPFNGVAIDYLCENPSLVKLFVAHRFSFLKSSWDWSWCDLRALDGFEGVIIEAYAPCRSLPLTFAELIARLFVAQRDYVRAIIATSGS